MTDNTDTDTDTETPPGQPQSVRCAVDVVAGILPGQAEPEFTRTFYLTSDEWHAADNDHRVHLLLDLSGQATAYANYLMLAPDRFNWVKLEWVWM